MKKLYVTFATILIFSVISYSQVVVDTPYTIATWQGFRPAAISFTFDDGCSNQFAVAIPMFNLKGLTATFYTVITGSMFPGWAKLQSAAAKGHEIASHSMTHPATLLGISTENAELKNSHDSIVQHIPGKQCIDIAYPNCNKATESLLAKYYVAGRICGNAVNAKNPSNFFNISAYICGSTGSYTTTASIITLANSAASSNGWLVYLIHGIDNDGGYSPVTSATLQGAVNYFDTTGKTKYWVQTFGNVVRYIKERNAASVTQLSRGTDSISLKVTDTLNDTIFNYPITIRRALPSGWLSAVVSQKDSLIVSQIKDSNSIKYVIFNAVPDGGNIVISRSSTHIQRMKPSGASITRDLKVWINHSHLLVGAPAFAGHQLNIAIYDLKGVQLAHFNAVRTSSQLISIVLPQAVIKTGMCIVHVTDGHSSWSKQCVIQ